MNPKIRLLFVAALGLGIASAADASELGEIDINDDAPGLAVRRALRALIAAENATAASRSEAAE